MLKELKKAFLLLCLSISGVVNADLAVPVFFVSEHGIGKVVGTINIHETQYGLLLTPTLHGLKPGLHGFHIHENPSCEHNAMAAGGHFDPQKTNSHLGPYNDNGHLGDLPVLYVASDGTATTPVLAPRLKTIKEIIGHAFMIHEGGDNYNDKPAKLGGGGGRMVCGVIR